MLKYAVLGTAATAQTPCDGAMMMLNSMDPAKNPVHTSMDISHYKMGDNQITVDKCRYGPMKPQGKVTWKCELTDNKMAIKSLTSTGDFDCVPKKKAEGVMSAVLSGAPAKISMKFYLHLYKIPNFAMNFQNPMKATCTDAVSDLAMDSKTAALYGQQADIVPGMTRILRAYQTHSPNKQFSPWMPDDLVGSTSVMVKSCKVYKANIIECEADAISDVKKWWKACKLDRVEKNKAFKQVRDATGNNPPISCVGLQVIAPYLPGLLPLSGYAMKFSGANPELTPYMADPAENKLCPKTAMEWNDNPLLESRVAGSMNVGMLLFFVMPAILAGVCLPIIALLCTCCCTCCCGQPICCAKKD